MNLEPRGRERRVRDRARLTLANLLREADGILALPGLEGLGDPDALADDLFRGARLDGPPPGPGVAWTPDGLPLLLGGLASALYRHGNVTLVARVDGAVELVAPLAPEPPGGPVRATLPLARLERATEGVGLSILARGLASWERLRRVRPDDTSAWAERERSHVRAQLVRDVGYRPDPAGGPPTLDPSVGSLLAWETVTILRDGVLAALADGAGVAEVRVPRLIDGAPRS